MQVAVRAVSRTVPARAARTFSTIDWTDVTSKLSTDAAKSEINRLRALYGEQANLAKTFSGPPAPIDFAAYAGKVDAELLAAAKKSYADFMGSDAKPEFKFDVRSRAQSRCSLPPSRTPTADPRPHLSPPPPTSSDRGAHGDGLEA